MIKIDADSGRIVVSARSGYGKTYLVKSLLKNALSHGWKVNILSYTEKKEADYWKELNDAGAKITFTNITDEKTLIEFLASVGGNSVIYVDDLDLYVSYKTKDALETLRKYMSASRKANFVLVFSLKDLKGNFFGLLKESSIAFIGAFSAFPKVLENLRFEDVRENFNKLDESKHEFLMLHDGITDFVRVDENGNIVLSR